MRKYLYPFLILLSALTVGCKQETCPESCGGNIAIVAVGFTRAELNSAWEYTYANDGTFKNPVDSFPLSDTGYWNYLSPADSTSDTLILLRGNSIGINGEATVPDYEFTFSSPNGDYKISRLMLGGALVDNYNCYEGGKYSGGNGCMPQMYLKSYIINRNQVNIPNANAINAFGTTVAGIIYIVK